VTEERREEVMDCFSVVEDVVEEMEAVRVLGVVSFSDVEDEVEADEDLR
jgi:hypothetical protein